MDFWKTLLFRDIESILKTAFWKIPYSDHRGILAGSSGKKFFKE